MPALTAGWTDTAGQPRGTTVTLTAGANRPVVVLLHGAGGTGADMVSPLSGPHAAMLFATHDRVPTNIDRGYRDYPGVGWWSMGVKDDPAHGVGWGPCLNAAGYPTAVYDQVEPHGLLANPARELEGVLGAVRLAMPTRGYVLLADSRGGLLARRWVADHAQNAPERGLLRAMITLHSPHQGSSLASTANALVSGLLAVAAANPTIAPAIHTYTDLVQTPDATEMAVGSPFLTQLAADEAAHGSAATPTFTFGGTNVTLVRVRNWAFTPQSAVPEIVTVIPPKARFHWNTVPQLLVSVADGLPAIGAMAPELQPGAGDLLVTDARARIPWAPNHITNDFSHADTLTNGTLQQQVLGILNTLPA